MNRITTGGLGWDMGVQENYSTMVPHQTWPLTGGG